MVLNILSCKERQLLLGLAGPKNSGKDVIGSYLVKEHGFERRSFADKLKESAAASLNVEAWQLEEWKNDPTMQIAVVCFGSIVPYNFASVRQFLQRYGTEAHREIFGENFWVDQVLPVEGFYAGRAIVVTDVRYRAEYDRILILGGHIIIVERAGLDLQDPHSSEQEWRTFRGYKVHNDGFIPDLYEKVEKMLVDLA
jgi:hypothetical protein